jgi:LacI family transcriptional regulator
MANVTIYDVAHAAGVSIATVSRVLNSPHQVNETTRQQVLAAIDRLGYVPKVEAMTRARQRYQRIGVLAPFFTVPSFVERLRGVASVVDGSPFELVVYNVDTPAHCQHYLESLPVTQRIDGLIVMSLRIHDRVAERFVQLGLPTVLIETTHPALSGVTIDNVAGGRLAAEHLLAQGYRRLAFVGGDSEIPGYTLHTSELRLTGFREMLQDAGLAIPEAYVRMTLNSTEYARQQAHILLDLPEPPTAIFAASDSLAMGVLKAVRERELRAPADVAVIGFDDLEIADYIGLTTVAQSLNESGRVAVEMLLARLVDPARPVQRVQLALNLVKRETA